MKTLRPYQEEAIAELSKIFNDSIAYQKKALLSLPCGGGKTFTGVSFAKKFLDLDKDNIVIWLVHKEELKNAAVSAFKSANISTSVLDSSSTNTNYELSFYDKKNKVHIMMIKTLISRFDIFWTKVSSENILIVRDEAHHEHANTWKYANEIINSKYILDLTATPSEKVLDKYHYIFNISFTELVKQGYLSKPIYERVKTNINVPGIKVGAGDFTLTSLKHLNIASRRKLIIRHWLDNVQKYQKTLLFVSSKAEALDLKDQLKKKTKYKIFFIHSGTTKIQRQRRFSQFNNAKDPCIMISVSIFIEGLDVPSIKTIFMCRPTLSNIVYTQSIGRGSRLKEEDTNEFYIVDFVDNIKRYESKSLSMIFDIIGEHIPEEIELELENKEKVKVLKKNKFKFENYELNSIIGFIRWNNKYKKYGKSILIEEDLEILYVIFYEIKKAVNNGKKFTTYDVNKIYAQMGTITSVEFKDFKSMIWSMIEQVQGGAALFKIHFIGNYKPNTTSFRTYETISKEISKELSLFNTYVLANTKEIYKQIFEFLYNYDYNNDSIHNKFELTIAKLENKILYIELSEKSFRKMNYKNHNTPCISSTAKLKRNLTNIIREILNDNTAEVTIRAHSS